jgi:TPR repeat protein
LVLIPSAVAAANLKRNDSYRLIRLNEIWSGPPIVVRDIEIRNQEITMIPIEPPAPFAAREYALEQLDPTDPIVQQLQNGGDWAKARALFRKNAQKPPPDARAQYNLGCVEMAEGNLARSLQSFAAVQQLHPSAALGKQTQRELRRACAMYLFRAEDDDPVAMRILGTAYERGWGVKQNFQEAKHWYRNASNAGDPEAMLRLAAAYEHQTGATIHTKKADEWYRAQTLEWYRKAATTGNEEANQWLLTHNQH